MIEPRIFGQLRTGFIRFDLADDLKRLLRTADPHLPIRVSHGDEIVFQGTVAEVLARRRRSRQP